MSNKKFSRAIDDYGCCPRCFDDRRLKSIIGRKGEQGNCAFCLSENVSVIDPMELANFFRPLLAGYQLVEAGTHYIPELQEADGEPLDQIVADDNPDLFADRLPDDRRQDLLQDVLNAVDGYDPTEGLTRGVGELWTRPGNEIWAGAEDDYFQTAPVRWTTFVTEITEQRRFVRLSPPADHDPAAWLTHDALTALTRRFSTRHALFRAVIGGRRDRSGDLVALPKERLAGPKPEHCRRGGRVNPPGVAFLYTATDASTAIAEVRPWAGGPVSVATLYPIRSLRLVDFSPRRRRKRTKSLPLDVVEIIETIGSRMSEPLDPDTAEVAYVPTQYVAELIRNAGYDGIMVPSALGRGRNVILFDTRDAVVRVADLYRVRRVDYETAKEEPAADFF